MSKKRRINEAAIQLLREIKEECPEALSTHQYMKLKDILKELISK